METKEKIRQKLHTLFLRAKAGFLRHWDQAALCLLAILFLAGCIRHIQRYVPSGEAALRNRLVCTARSFLGLQEADGSHQVILDIYNSHSPSPRDYQITPEDNWCAAFGSAVAIESGLTDRIPVECSCEQQILLFDSMGCWQEDECHLPQPGDYIYYVWDEWRDGDCTAWANHVGIVSDTYGPVIRVIEGNKDDCVSYRYLYLNDITIRGYGLPDYEK